MIATTAAPDVLLDALDEGTLLVQPAASGPTWLKLPPTTVEVLLALADGPISLAELPTDEVSRAAVLALARDGALQFSVVIGRREVLRASLTRASSPFDPIVPGDAGVRLSRFVLLRRDGEELVLDVPATGVRVALLDRRAVTVVAELTRRRTCAQLRASLLDCSLTFIDDTVQLLLGLGAVAVVDDDGLLPEDRHPVLRHRELPDVLLHAASRTGFGAAPAGTAYPVRRPTTTRLPAARATASRSPATGAGAPAVVAAPVSATVAASAASGSMPVGASSGSAVGARRVALHRPESAALPALEPHLAALSVDGCTVRHLRHQVLTAEQLGDFLFRVVSAGRPLLPPGHPDPSGLPHPRTVTDGAFVLDLYLTVLHCSGLTPGVWHYEPASHALTLVNGDRDAVLRMLADVRRAPDGTGGPKVLVTFASQWERLTRHRGVAYALLLKQVGVLYAAMQLAAAAMGLAGHPSDLGDAALFAEVTGCDPDVVSSVGEFVLAGAPEHGPAVPRRRQPPG